MNIRTGTVGYNYREWMGIFYPPGTQIRRQLQIYSDQFDVCELTNFTHQMPDAERVARFAAQVKSDLKFYIRLHNTFTQCADMGLALSLARHFRKAMEPLYDAGKLAGFVAAFPYVFKDSPDRRQYLTELASTLAFEKLPLQLDFRHSSWFTDEAIEWMRQSGLALLCVDEPQLPGLVPPLSVATTDTIVVRLHGRNAEGWWSGNVATRYDYLYSEAELAELVNRYAPLFARAREIHFLFQNNWEAHSIQNAQEWKQLVSQVAPFSTIASDEERSGFEHVASPSPAVPHADPVIISPAIPVAGVSVTDDEDTLRPPTSLPMSELKSRVNQALRTPLQVQGVLDMPSSEWSKDFLE